MTRSHLAKRIVAFEKFDFYVLEKNTFKADNGVFLLH